MLAGSASSIVVSAATAAGKAYSILVNSISMLVDASCAACEWDDLRCTLMHQPNHYALSQSMRARLAQPHQDCPLVSHMMVYGCHTYKYTCLCANMLLHTSCFLRHTNLLTNNGGWCRPLLQITGHNCPLPTLARPAIASSCSCTSRLRHRCNISGLSHKHKRI